MERDSQRRSCDRRPGADEPAVGRPAGEVARRGRRPTRPARLCAGRLVVGDRRPAALRRCGERWPSACSSARTASRRAGPAPTSSGTPASPTCPRSTSSAASTKAWPRTSAAGEPAPTTRSLTGSAMALLGGWVPDGSFLDQTRWYFGLWAVLATVLVVAMVWLTAASRPRHVADAAALALSPVLLLSGTGLGRPVRGGPGGRRHLGLGATPTGAGRGVPRPCGRRPGPIPCCILVALALLAMRTGRLGRGGPHGRLPRRSPVRSCCCRSSSPTPGRSCARMPAWWDVPGRARLAVDGPAAAGAPAALGCGHPAGGRRHGGGTAAGRCSSRSSTWRRPSLAEVALVMVGDRPGHRQVLPRAVLAVAGAARRAVRRPLARPPGVGRCRGAALRRGVALRRWHCPSRTAACRRGWYAVFLVLRVLAVGYLVWRVWHTAALRDEAPTRATRRDGAVPDPDSDAVVDELAATSATPPTACSSASPDRRHLGTSWPAPGPGPCGRRFGDVVARPGTLVRFPRGRAADQVACLRGSHCNPPVTERP